MSKSPCFPFYTSDFFGDIHVRLMSPDARAFYSLLILNIWEYDTQFSIPNDEKIIQNLLQISEEKFRAIFPEILPCFQEKNGRLVSKRLKHEKDKQLKYIKLQSLKGKKSAEKRSTTVQPRLNHGSTEGVTEAQPKVNSSIPIPIPKPIPIKTKKETNYLFEKFWYCYPKKQGRGKAEESWNKIKPSEELFLKMVETIEKFKQSEQWNNENGKYIPLPATWLNQKRWLDEIDKPKILPPKSEGRVIPTSHHCHNCKKDFTDYNEYLKHNCKEEARE